MLCLTELVLQLSFFYYSHSNLEDTFKQNEICSQNAANFCQKSMDYGMWDFSQLLEKWASAKVKGNHTINTLSMMQKECSAIINSTLRKFLLYLNLLRYLCYLTEMVSQSGQALINYPNYDTKVIEHYHKKLIGWTYPEFKSPFNIHTYYWRHSSVGSAIG